VQQAKSLRAGNIRQAVFWCIALKDVRVGELLALARYSYIDLNSGTRTGCRFWRFTPMVNWHMSPNVRLEMTYGVGTLDRFSLEGRTQFFQTRIQFQL
jgi:hypothetical protein